MATTQIFPSFPSAHDPDTAQRWQVQFYLPIGRTPQSITVTSVDAADNPLDQSTLPSPQQLALTDLQSEQSDVATNLWQVSFLATGGLAGTVYRIRFRITLDGDSVPFADRTFQLRCAQT